MALQWFRYHAEVLDNKRVQRLPADLFKVWVNCQCILTQENVGSSGKLPPMDECAFRLRKSVEETVIAFDALVDAGLFLKRNETVSETKSTVSCNKNETLFSEQKTDYFVKGWGNKQYKSDTSTDRVKRFRERSKTVTETPPDTDTDSEVLLPTGNNTARGRANISCPPDVDEKVWADFMLIRKKKKAPMTDTALEGLQREASKAGIFLNDALRECCARGWQGFKAEWMKNDNAQGDRNAKNGNGKSQRAREAALRGAGIDPI